MERVREQPGRGVLDYAGRDGHTLIDRRVYLSASWTEDRDRCQAAGVPDEVGFAATSDLAAQMITSALDCRGAGQVGGGPGPLGLRDPRAGSYLPVIHALRDDLTLLHGQNYNSGPILGLDNQYHTMGGADFPIAMTDMLLAGFPVAGNPDRVFAALRENQVAFSAPSSVSAGNGYVPPAGVQAAVNCLVHGQSCGSYSPHSGTSPTFRGLMTWSVNWDRYYNCKFQLHHGPFLKALP